MGLLADIRSLLQPMTEGRKGADDDAAAVSAAEGALRKLATSRAAIEGQLAQTWERRQALLKEDDTDDEISAIDAERDRLHRDLERLDLAEPGLLAALESARAAARQAHWRRLRAKWHAAVPAYAAAMRDAARQYHDLAAIREEAQQNGFATEVAHTFQPAPVMVHDLALLNAFEASAERRADDVVAIPPPSPAAEPSMGVKPTTAAPAPSSSPPPASMPRTRRKRVTVSDPPDGHVAIIVLRNGYTDTAGEARDIGDIVFLPPDLAERAVRSGAVEYHSEAAP